MKRLIDADAFHMILVKMKDFGELTAKKAIRAVENAPTIDAIPISFIEEQVKLCNEIGFRRGEECYMALIEKWREKNGTKTD